MQPQEAILRLKSGLIILAVLISLFLLILGFSAKTPTPKIVMLTLGCVLILRLLMDMRLKKIPNNLSIDQKRELIKSVFGNNGISKVSSSAIQMAKNMGLELMIFSSESALFSNEFYVFIGHDAIHICSYSRDRTGYSILPLHLIPLRRIKKELTESVGHT